MNSSIICGIEVKKFYRRLYDGEQNLRVYNKSLLLYERVQRLYKDTLSYEPYGPAIAFFAKPLMKVLYEVRTHLREWGRKELYGPTTKAYGLLNFKKNWSPNWSYDKILID